MQRTSYWPEAAIQSCSIKRCCEKYCKVKKKTSVSESFNKVLDSRTFFFSDFFQSTSGGLLLTNQVKFQLLWQIVLILFSLCSKRFWRLFRSSHRRCSVSNGVLRKFANFTAKHLCQGPFLIKKETLAHVFSCELYEISKNTYFTEHLWTIASRL